MYPAAGAVVDIVDLRDIPDIYYSDVSQSHVVENGRTNLPLGQYAAAQISGDEAVLFRDPLGCNKLFYSRDSEGRLVIANRFRNLMEYGVPFSSIASCPAGNILSISQEGAVTTLGEANISMLAPDENWQEKDFCEKVGARLHQAFQRISDQFAAARFVVCLSGGLDSAIIASLAARYLKRVEVISFCLLSTVEQARFVQQKGTAAVASVSEDFLHAAEVANSLGLDLIPSFRTPDAIANAITPAMILCQDWRDFNVHCAIVNYFLAEDIRARYPGEQVIALTGDIMNEVLCDYHEEVVDGTVYYPQPRISMASRRRHFVRGLDAGDREVGVFNGFGIPVCQPYAAVANLYMSIPPTFLAEPDFKRRLNGPMLPANVLDKICGAKTRAQVGGEDKGVLGICHRQGFGSAALRQMWADSLRTITPEAALSLIEIGRYRTSGTSA